MFSQVLHYLPHTPTVPVDLRTVAALAYTVPGRRQKLHTNPTGHYAHRLQTGTTGWEPALDFAHSFFHERPGFVRTWAVLLLARALMRKPDD